MFLKMLGNPFESKVMTTRKDQGRLFCFWKNKLLQEERVGPGAVELLGHPARLSDLADLDEVCRLKCEHVVTNPCRGLLHGPRELRQCGGRSHEQAQNVHAAGIGENLDIPKRMNRFDLLHFN